VIFITCPDIETIDNAKFYFLETIITVLLLSSTKLCNISWWGKKYVRKTSEIYLFLSLNCRHL